LALSLARPEDDDSLEAWLATPLPLDTTERLAAVEELVASRRGADLLRQGHLLGLPLALLDSEADGRAVLAAGDGAPRRPLPLAGAFVVDLSSLWAGPLCARLLRRAGARVVKVESTGRPDGARRGKKAVFDGLHTGVESVALDFTSPAGRAELAGLLATADIVIEGSRPRALRQLGIAVEEVLAAGRVTAWLAITAHGRRGRAGERVGFGDDAAVAGGLVAWYRGEPSFLLDAVADPLAGMVGACAVAAACRRGGRWLLDLSLARTARYVAGPRGPRRDWLTAADRRDLEMAEPIVPVGGGQAPGLGVDTAAVLASCGLR
jgi:hypothetical protein